MAEAIKMQYPITQATRLRQREREREREREILQGEGHWTHSKSNMHKTKGHLLTEKLVSFNFLLLLIWSPNITGFTHLSYKMFILCVSAFI